MRAGIGCVISASLILTNTSCSHVVHRPLDREVTEHMDVEKSWLEIQGWTDRSGGRHALEGYAQVTEESVLVYTRRPGSKHGSMSDVSPTAALFRADVAEVHVRRFSLLKTAEVVVIPLAALIGLAAATKENSIGD